jgi:hypothetical protein
MRFGRRKTLAVGGLVVFAAISLVAWLIWDTDGLVAGTLTTLVIATLGLGWLVAESQRQITSLLGEIRMTILAAIEASGEPDDRAERLLRAVQTGFLRSDHTLDTLVSEWRQTREEMLSSVASTVEREIGVIGREVGVIGREVRATTSLMESALDQRRTTASSEAEA